MEIFKSALNYLGLGDLNMMENDLGRLKNLKKFNLLSID